MRITMNKDLSRENVRVFSRRIFTLEGGQLRPAMSVLEQMLTRLRSWNLWLAILALLLFAGQGCGGVSREGSISDSPIHIHVICKANADGSGLAGDESERLSAFGAWMGERALFVPCSTFTIWRVGPDREQYSPYFTTCVPSSWGPGVMEAKATFVRRAREGARAGGMAFPKGCTPPGPDAPGIQRLRVSEAIPNPELWRGVASRSAVEGPLHVAVVCDRSSSTRKVGCTESGLLGAFDRWIAGSVVTTDSSFSIYLVGQSTGSVRRIYRLGVPERSVGEKAAFAIGARGELAHLLADASEEDASALAEAIHVAVGEMRERAGRYRLEILSDLRQYTPGRWNFERVAPDAREFVAWLQNERMLADLSGVPVTVSGVHHHDSSAGHLAQIRETWDVALRALGAAEVRILSE